MTVDLATDFERVAGMRCECFCHTEGFAGDASQHQCCRGTRYRYHWLWRECNVNTSIGHMEAQRAGKTCPFCLGTRYVLIEGDRTDGLLRVAREKGWHVTIWSDGRVSVLDGATELAFEDTLAEALVKALEVA